MSRRCSTSFHSTARNFTQLLITQPGNNPINTAQGGNGIGSADGGNIGIPTAVVYRPSVNGAGNRSNAFYVDGIIATDDRGGGWSFQPIADTIQEFKVQSHNNDAQYGNVLGAVVNVVTKAGGNRFHGSAWDFARNQIFDARNPFTGFCTPASCPSLEGKLTSEEAAGTVTPAGASAILTGTPVSPLGYTQQMYGGTFGGPIIKNKTFFYFGYEGWHFSQPQNSYANVPTAQELAGVLQLNGNPGTGGDGQRQQDRHHSQHDLQSLRRIGRKFHGPVLLRWFGQSDATLKSRRRLWDSGIWIAG